MGGLVTRTAARGDKFDFILAVGIGGEIVGLAFDNPGPARHVARDRLFQAALATVIAFLLGDVDLFDRHRGIVLNINGFAIGGGGAKIHRVGGGGRGRRNPKDRTGCCDKAGRIEGSHWNALSRWMGVRYRNRPIAHRLLSGLTLVAKRRQK